MRPLAQTIIPAEQDSLFSKIVLSAFSQRRKTLRNTLRGYLKPEDFDALALDSGLRAENLSVEQFADIVNYLEGMR
jgi:16S rRNA (adenine1518-N6/adenine1519-N6)-dimethyltransferase